MTETNCRRSSDLPLGRRTGEVQRDGAVVDDDPVLHERHGGVDVLALLRVGGFLQRGGDRCGVERRTAVKFDVVAQGDRHGSVVGRDLPRRREARDGLSVRRVLDEAVVDVLDEREVDRRELLRIEVGDIGQDRDAQPTALEIGRPTSQRCKQGRQRENACGEQSGRLNAPRAM